MQASPGQPVRTSALLVAGLLACGSIEPDPIIDPPRNVCSGTPCAEGDFCNSRGFCETDEKDLDFVLVLPMPDTAFYAPNVTYLLSQRDLAQVSVTGREECPGNCISIPRLTVFEGRYFVSGAGAEQLGTTLYSSDGDKLAPAAIKQLPIRATYTPQVMVDGVAVDATDLGLPLGKILARVTVDTAAPLDRGIGTTKPVYTAANVPPGTYRVEYEVEPSLQSFAPPRADRIEVLRSQFTQTDRIPFTVDVPDPAPARTTVIKSRYRKLDGFQAYLVEVASGRRISRVAEMRGSQNDEVYLATVNQDDDGQLPGNVDFVLAPPPNSYAPTLQTRVIGRLLAPEYPELPPPAIVEGVVNAQGGGVRADLELVSEEIVLLRNEGLLGDQLHYRTRVSTDGDGRFATIVPEGTYRVYADPDPTRNVGRRETRLATRGAEAGALFGLRTTWNVPLGPKSIVTGQAILGDSRILGGVGVSFAPSQYRWTDSRFELPRPLRTTTNGRGEFAADLDEGFYDLTIAPTTGTGFAPFVRTDLFVPQRLERGCTLALGRLEIEIPAVYPITLRDSSDNVIPLAWARMFARATGSQHYVEIQHELLDANGSGQLLFRKPERAPLRGCDP